MSPQTTTSNVVSSLSFSFRPPEPPRPAAELLAEIHKRGGRVFRMRSERVCCLTDDPELAVWLTKLGAKSYSTVNHGHGLDGHAPGAFYRARPNVGGKVEYDVWIHTIPVEGDLWKEAG
jgi:hypothetical protein